MRVSIRQYASFLLRQEPRFTTGKMTHSMRRIEESIERYLAALDAADRDEPAAAQSKPVRIKDKITALKEKIERLKELETKMNAAPDKQISLSDPDARAMVLSGGRSGIVGYNLQAAVDTKHHLIVAHEVTNVGNDRTQLSSMAKLAREAMHAEEFTAIADRGYYKGEEIFSCHEAGITALVPKSLTSNNKAEGLFDKEDFKYVPDQDEYRCPAGQQLIKRFTSVEDGKKLTTYWSSNCKSCELKSRCTPSRNGASNDGNTKQSSIPCRRDWLPCRTLCAYASAPLSTGLGP